jgi:hypothetical protein
MVFARSPNTFHTPAAERKQEPNGRESLHQGQLSISKLGQLLAPHFAHAQLLAIHEYDGTDQFQPSMVTFESHGQRSILAVPAEIQINPLRFIDQTLELLLSQRFKRSRSSSACARVRGKCMASVRSLEK